MTETLALTINDDSLHAIEVPSGDFEAGGSFTIALTNEGRPTHVHLHLDDALSRAATLESNNHYVDDALHRVDVAVDATRLPVSGMLKVVTGYGATTEYVDVTLDETAVERPQVEVDESLGVPQPPEPEPDPVVERVRENLPLAVLGGLALVLAVGTTMWIRSPVVAFGAIAVLGGLVLALYFLVS